MGSKNYKGSKKQREKQEERNVRGVLVLDGRSQDEEYTRCESQTNSKVGSREMYVTGYVHMM
jgi:hypothetical protein